MKKYEVTLKFKREILGSKSLDPSIFLLHKIESTRKSIDKWAKSESKNQQAIPFLDAAEITDEDVQANLQALKRTIEEYLGEPLTKEQWEAALANDLKKDSPLFQMLKENKGHTVFARTSDSHPGIEVYVLKGATKELASIVYERDSVRLGFLKSKQFTASILNRHMFIEFVGTADEDISPFWADPECTIPKDVERGDDGKSDGCTRSLRANTPQGPIVSLMTSERITPTAYIKFRVVSFIKDVDEKALRKIYEVGEYYGASQWRNAGKGRFEIVNIKEVKE